MKKIFITLMFFCLFSTMVCAEGLQGTSFILPISEVNFNLAFDSDTVTMTGPDDFEAIFNYYYDGVSLGSIEETIPFYVYQNWIVLVVQSLIGTKVEEVEPEPEPEPEPDPDPIDLSKVKWLHTNVSGWKVTSKLSDVKIGSTTITLNHDKACAWPGETSIYGENLAGNAWIFVSLDGTWYAATWEWLKVCQTTKQLIAVNGDHIKVSPLDTWSPKSGEKYYFMVSGLARYNERNVSERSNLVEVIWP